MNTKLIYISITSIFLVALSLQGKEAKLQQREEILARFNQGLEIIESKLRSSNYNASCAEAITTIKLIEDEYFVLKEIEPYYDWAEIKKVLLSIPGKYCPDQSIQKLN